MKKQTKLGLVLAAAAVMSVSVASLVSARGWVQNGADWYYVDNNNEYVTDTIQASGNSKFYLGEDGAMMRDYFLEEYGDSNNAYYFGQNGAMVTNTWVAIESSRVENTEDYIPDNYWYYFQASGKAMKAGSGKVKKTTIDGKKYAFNEFGQMLTGWITDEGKVVNPDDNSNPFDNAVYYAGGDNDGVLRAGWVTYYEGYDGGDDNPESEYTNLYFYFNTSNNKKYGAGTAETKKINGKTYAFSSEGVMLSGWDAWTEGVSGGAGKPTYFSGEDDGHQVKKGWVYAVPAYDIDSAKYMDDEEVYMYFGSSGDITKDQFKKINGKFYAFNRTGIMKTGVIIWCADGTTAGVPATDTTGLRYKFVDTLDLDYAEGSEIAKKGILRTGDGNSDFIKVDKDGKVLEVNGLAGKVAQNDVVRLHLYGQDGARKTGANNVEFADDTYTLQTNGNSGDKGSGAFSKKYYSLGIQLKASADIRYGIYSIGSPSAAGRTTGPLTQQGDMDNYRSNLIAGDYIVLTTGGQLLKGNAGGKKDADGNYWLVDKNRGNTLRGIWTVNVSLGKSYGSFTTRTANAIPAGLTATNTCTYDDLVAAGLAVDGANTPLADAGAVWTSHPDTTRGTVYFTLHTTVRDVPSFQSDYNDGSNKWIPMGILDNSNKTTTLEEVADIAAHGYDVKPNNDYFLNCYWSN